MLLKTRGIALRLTNYSESSVVAQIYTEELGLQSYLINGAKKPKAKIHINMLQPLHLLEMVVYNKNGNGLQRIKEAQQYPVLQQIPLDIVRSSIVIFLNEVLYKVLKHQVPDGNLFQFIHQSILWLDQTPEPIHNFHLSFLMKLSKFLGYLPTTTPQVQTFFDLEEGSFAAHAPAHSNILQGHHTHLFHSILRMSYEESSMLRMNHNDRVFLLHKIVDFYKFHTENFGQIYAIEILEEVFH